MKIKVASIYFLSIIILLFHLTICSYFSIKLDARITEKDFKSSNEQDRQILLEEYMKDENKILVSHTYEENQGSLQKDPFKNSILNLLNEKENLAVVKIRNYYNVQYFGNIYVGSNKQAFSVIFDTGSNILWLSSKDCMDCRNYTQKFAYNESFTYKNLNNNKNITYAIGFVDGNYVEDNVYVGKRDLTESQNTFSYYMGIEQFKFLLVNYEEYLDGTVADGVMGLGLDFEGDFHTSFIYMLYMKGQISSPQFYFYLSDGRLDSRLYIGDIRKENTYLENKFKRMNSCSISQMSRYWQCDLSTIEITANENSIERRDKFGINTSDSAAEGLDYNKNNTLFSFTSGSKVIFDTGTSFLVIPVSDFINLAPLFSKKALENKCGVTTSLQFICKCKAPRDFDNIVLNLKSSDGTMNKFTIVTENLVDYFPTLEYQCRFQILLDIFLGDFWILGDSVLRDSLISFDMQERKIGWIQNFVKIDDSVFEPAVKNETQTGSESFIYNYFMISLFILGGVLFIYLIWKCCCSWSSSVPQYSRENLI